MTFRTLLLQLLRLIIPSPDPIRRARFRWEARTLITCSPWPGKTAAADQVAQLALARLLYLQRLVRKQARLRQNEVAALLSRAAVETSIVGIYCIYVPGALDQLNAHNTKSLQRLLEPLVDDVVFTAEMIAAGISEMNDPSTMPTLRAIVEAIERADGPVIAKHLYDRIYAPVSTLYSHASGVPFLRHVHNNDRVTIRPTYPWTVNGSVHTVDTCVGLLAAALAPPESDQRSRLELYARDHWKRTPLPATTMFLKHFVTDIKVKNMSAAIRALREVRHYVKGEAINDDAEVRRNRIRQGLGTVFAVVGTPMPDILADKFVERIVADIETRTESTGP